MEEQKTEERTEERTREQSTAEQCCTNHNRLDLIRHIDDYQHPWCGSPKPIRGRQDDLKPDYCCFECPVLHGKEPPPHPDSLEEPRQVTMAHTGPPASGALGG